MIILLFIGLGILTALIQMYFAGFPSSIDYIAEVVLLHQFLVPNILIGVLGFYINVITPKKTAEKLGWPSGPFQIKYGFTQLHLGVMGVLSIWFRGNFWVATLVTLYFYGLSGLWTHTLEYLRKDKKDKVEVWSIVFDILYHVILTVISFYVPGMWTLS